MKIMIINGPNMNMLGIREKELYGTDTYIKLCETIDIYCKNNGIEHEIFTSNHEGALVDCIQRAYFEQFDGIVINPAAYTHTSIALLDSVKAVGIPTVEVHLTDVDEREDFRKVSFIRSACVMTVKGKGIKGYLDAIEYLSKKYGKQ